MKSIYLLLLLPLFAQSQDNSLLWKITGPEEQYTSYLFGSIHSNDSLLNTFSDEWWRAFLSCQVLAGEVNSTDPKEMLASLENSMMKDTSLSDLYTPDEFSRVKKYLYDHLDSRSVMVVGRMKPFYIMASIMEMPTNEGPYSQVMDIRLQALANQNKMKVVGLESTAEQSKSIEVISLKDQAAMLLEFIDAQDPERIQLNPPKTPVMQEDMERLENAYLDQNLDSLNVMMGEMDEMMPSEFSESLLGKRNERFVANLLPLLQTNNVFCAVGAMHLAGPEGMIAMLKKRGYKVEPIKFTFTESKLKLD